MLAAPDPSFAAGLLPTVASIDNIAACPHPIVRNLQITQCYHELSAAMARRTGPGANWCTFATWASRQAGQTIRKEDLLRTLEALLPLEPEVAQALSMVAILARQLGVRQSGEEIRRSAVASLVGTTVQRASDAVSRGNKKVFEEIGREVARFMATCSADATYSKTHIEDFCSALRPGPPPDGQQYLRQAFTAYYLSFFEPEAKKRAELQLLANLQIGFHEQTRLQPEIAESLNAAAIDPQQVKTRLLAILFPPAGYRDRLRLFFQRLFQQTSLLDEAVETLVLRAQHHLRRILTAHLMILTLPPDRRLLLGHDLAVSFPELLQQLSNADLQALLAQVDPTPDSLRQSGAVDWADLPERMHFIADLFRCYHESKDLFLPPFTPAQVADLKAGVVPGGRL